MSLFRILRFITGHPLNRGQRLRAVLRFVKWQVGSRLVPGSIVYDWVRDSRFLVKTGETGLTGNIYTGLQEFSDMGFLLHVLRDEDLFVDVGANVGSFTILASSAVGARSIAFEPVPGTFERLTENIHLNRLGERVMAENKGVGARRGNIRFTNDSDTTNHALASDEQHVNTVDVEVTTLDDSLREESPALMKIDVEGYETPVLEGAQRALGNPSLHSVIMELNGSGERYGHDESKILELMLDFGFKTYSYDPLKRVLLSLEGKNLDSGNTLFIRNSSFVEERVRSAPMVSIHGHQI